METFDIFLASSRRWWCFYQYNIIYHYFDTWLLTQAEKINIYYAFHFTRRSNVVLVCQMKECSSIGRNQWLLKHLMWILDVNSLFIRLNWTWRRIVLFCVQFTRINKELTSIKNLCYRYSKNPPSIDFSLVKNAGSHRWRRDAERQLHSTRDASSCRSVATPVCHIFLERDTTHIFRPTVHFINTEMKQIRPNQVPLFL